MTGYETACNPCDIESVTHSFIYQAQLSTFDQFDTLPISCVWQSSLYDVEVGGTELTNPYALQHFTIDGGLFTAILDFGPDVFDGNARWVEIQKKCGDETAFSRLTPRQPLIPAPYALAIPGFRTQVRSPSPNVIGGYFGNHTVPGVGGAVIGGGGELNGANRALNRFSVVAGGANNQAGDGANPTDSTKYATVGGGMNNLALGRGSTVAGGTWNQAGNQVNPPSSLEATVCGGLRNKAIGSGSTVAGGIGNVAEGRGSFIGGGARNATSTSGDYSFAAGYRARANNPGSFVFADRSQENDFVSTSSNQFLIRAENGVGIGTNGPNAMLHIDGGKDASLQNGSGFVVVGTISGANLVLDNNELIARNNGAGATLHLQTDGGTVILGFHKSIRLAINRQTPQHPIHAGTNSTNGNGAYLSRSGIWYNACDQNSKEGFVEIDKHKVLNKVAQLPVMQWQFKGDPDGIQHIGPMAQDFYALFSLGGDERSIGTSDADGVVLAAIQALYETIHRQGRELDELREQESRELGALRDAVSRLENTVDQLIAHGKQ